MDEDKQFLMAMSALASACTKALSIGTCCSDGRASLRHHFPGCCLVRYHALAMLHLRVSVLLLLDRQYSRACHAMDERKHERIIQE